MNHRLRAKWPEPEDRVHICVHEKMCYQCSDDLCYLNRFYYHSLPGQLCLSVGATFWKLLEHLLRFVNSAVTSLPPGSFRRDENEWICRQVSLVLHLHAKQPPVYICVYAQPFLTTLTRAQTSVWKKLQAVFQDKVISYHEFVKKQPNPMCHRIINVDTHTSEQLLHDTFYVWCDSNSRVTYSLENIFYSW